MLYIHNKHTVDAETVLYNGDLKIAYELVMFLERNEKCSWPGVWLLMAVSDFFFLLLNIKCSFILHGPTLESS